MSACSGCGAANEPTASFCWLCYRPMLAVAAVGSSEAVAAAPPGPGKWHVRLPTLGRAIRHTLIATLVLAVVSGIVLYVQGRRIEMPDSIAGMQKVAAPEWEQPIEEFEREFGVAAEGAIYATGDGRGIAVIASAQMDDLRPRRRLGTFPTREAGVALGKSRTKAFRTPDTYFACAPFSGQWHGTLCLWNGARTSGVVYAIEHGMAEARRVVVEVQRSIGV